MDTLRHYPVLLSASLPDELKGTAAADDLYGLLVVLVGGILSRGGTLVFGGHPSVTPLVHRVARDVQLYPAQIRLFQLNRFQNDAPVEVEDQSVFGKPVWIGDVEKRKETLATDLNTMRHQMAQEARAAIFVGGRVEGFLGGRPGVVDEYYIFRERQRRGPTYLLGALAGATTLLIRDHADEENTLTKQERQMLHETGDVDLAASLVLMDLERNAREGGRG